MLTRLVYRKFYFPWLAQNHASHLFLQRSYARSTKLGIARCLATLESNQADYQAQLRLKYGLNLTPFQNQQLPEYVAFLREAMDASFLDVLSIFQLDDGLILKMHISLISSKLNLLQKQFLVSNKQVLKVLKADVVWLYAPLSHVENILKSLVSYSVPMNQVGSILSKYPKLLKMDTDEFDEKLQFFNENFFTSKEIQTLLINFPDVLDRDSEELQKIYNYVTETFNMTQEEMIKSIIFKFSFNYVYSRFEFMRKRGLYIGKDKRGVYPAARQAHPLKILASSEKSFLNEVALSNEMEFASFCNSLGSDVKNNLSHWKNSEILAKIDRESEMEAEKVYDGFENVADRGEKLWSYLKTKYS